MRHRTRLSAWSVLTLLATYLITLNASALQIGQLTAHSRIGEPLDATIGLWLNAADKKQLKFKISPDLAYIKNTRLTEIVNRLKARLEHSATGIAYVSITTSSAIAEPIVAFRLKVYAGDVALMRNFALALNPAPAQVQPTISDRDRVPTPAKQSAAIEGPTYTVASGDTLWKIARRAGRSSTANTATLVQQIFAANPHAFVNGNQDRLRLGAELKLQSNISSIAAAANDNAMPMPQPSAFDVTSSDASETAQPGLTAGLRIVPQAPSQKLAPQQPGPEVATQLAALKERYAALKARYDDQTTANPGSTDIAGIADAPIIQDLQAIEDSLNVAVTASPVEQKLQSAPPATRTDNAVLNVTNEDPGMAAETNFFGSVISSTPLLFALTSIIAVAVIVFLAMLAGKQISKLRLGHAKRKHDVQEAERKEEVASKAKNRIEMESMVKRLLGERDSRISSTSAVEAAAPGGTSAQPTVEGNDTDIDLNIAHGRYDEAEKPLRKVIAAAPRNYTAKLRLVEVYYMTERIADFCSLADDLQDNHRADMADGEWRRVVRMGKIITPDEVRFNGPRAVSSPPKSA